MDKSVIKSRTFWFTVLTFIGGLVPAVQEFIVANPEAFTTVWSFLALALRLATKGGVVLVENKQ